MPPMGGGEMMMGGYGGGGYSGFPGAFVPRPAFPASRRRLFVGNLFDGITEKVPRGLRFLMFQEGI